MAESKKHHFIPRSVLRRFSQIDAPGTVFVYDKQRDTNYSLSITDAGMENGFNTVVVGGERINFETEFGRADELMAGVHNRLVEVRKITNLSSDDRLVLADTTALQLVRTKMFRTTLRSASRAMIDEFLRVGLLDGEPLPMDEQAARAMAREALHEREHQPDILNNKDLLLLEPEPDTRFWISDDPIVRYNPQPYGENGLSSPGIEVYWPIAADLALGFMCPTFRRSIEAGLALGDELEESLRDRCNDLRAAFEKGTPTKIGRGGTAMFLNGLQARSSSRFIYSSDNNFESARTILSKNPELRSVESMVRMGRIGEGPARRANMPPGLQLVVYGREDHYIAPLTSYEDTPWGFNATFEYAAHLDMLVADQPWKAAYVFKDGVERRGMRELRASKSRSGKRLRDGR
jgi:hypothetical protein